MKKTCRRKIKPGDFWHIIYKEKIFGRVTCHAKAKAACGSSLVPRSVGLGEANVHCQQCNLTLRRTKFLHYCKTDNSSARCGSYLRRTKFLHYCKTDQIVEKNRRFLWRTKFLHYCKTIGLHQYPLPRLWRTKFLQTR